MREIGLTVDTRHNNGKQLENGRISNGFNNLGNKRYPPCYLSFDKGKEFSKSIENEVEDILHHEEITQHGITPQWTLDLHKLPAYTDESPLIRNDYLAASKLAQTGISINLHIKQPMIPSKRSGKPPKRKGQQFYRPNKTHQYLTATELRDCTEEDPILKYGRPTRTTLLRARQRSNSAPTSYGYSKRKDVLPQSEEPQRNGCFSQPIDHSYIVMENMKEGESLHSYLTGARYNRLHCLDARSVDHTGIYMPRNNPAHGAFFTGPKGHLYISEFIESARDSSPRSSTQGKKRPLTAPSRRPPHIQIANTSRRQWQQRPDSSERYKPKNHDFSLSVVGCRLLPDQTKERNKLPTLQSRPQSADRQHVIEVVEEDQEPPPTTPNTAVKLVEDENRPRSSLDVNLPNEEQETKNKLHETNNEIEGNESPFKQDKSSMHMNSGDTFTKKLHNSYISDKESINENLEENKSKFATQSDNEDYEDSQESAVKNKNVLSEENHYTVDKLNKLDKEDLKQNITSEKENDDDKYMPCDIENEENALTNEENDIEENKNILTNERIKTSEIDENKNRILEKERSDVLFFITEQGKGEKKDENDHLNQEKQT